MGQKHYPQAVRDEAVLFYERGHTFLETNAKYGMSESTFYEWKKKFDQIPPVPEPVGNDLSSTRKAQRHLEKLSLELEVLRQCPCGIHASIDEKMAAINVLGNIYSVHVLCDSCRISSCQSSFRRFRNYGSVFPASCSAFPRFQRRFRAYAPLVIVLLTAVYKTLRFERERAGNCRAVFGQQIRCQ